MAYLQLSAGAHIYYYLIFAAEADCMPSSGARAMIDNVPDKHNFSRTDEAVL
jgi:hypothetical protein